MDVVYGNVTLVESLTIDLGFVAAFDSSFHGWFSKAYISPDAE
jgi:hypothetical protein